MPDGDIFQRKLRGTGRWVTVSRLLSNGSTEWATLEKSISKAYADDLGRISLDAVPSCLTFLLSAMNEEKRSRYQPGFFRSDTYLVLEQELRLFRRDCNFEILNILKDSVRSVFVSSRNECESLSDDQISDKLGETLIGRVLDERLSRIRDDLMLTQKRNLDEQMQLEKELRGKMMPIGRKMMCDFKNGKTKKFRAPIVRRAQKKSATDFLNQSIPVLP